MHQLKLECRAQGCGAIVHLPVNDLSDEEHVDMTDAQYYVDHRVPAKCGTCYANDWKVYGVSYFPAETRLQLVR